jgi:hypothetical protein
MCVRVVNSLVLRGITGPKRGGGIIGACKELHNEELHTFYSSPKYNAIIE